MRLLRLSTQVLSFPIIPYPDVTWLEHIRYLCHKCFYIMALMFSSSGQIKTIISDLLQIIPGCVAIVA